MRSQIEPGVLLRYPGIERQAKRVVAEATVELRAKLYAADAPRISLVPLHTVKANSLSRRRTRIPNVLCPGSLH